ncbi:pantothenate synthetase [Pseudobacteriovorax antillogorgiicola]|uniref:Pantothenate synthetase n=1 Tax=Pseudobacteriovorax antillogorgiicola TaxID=1513793 RepID=A0A1Y6C550_9BACT|nr:pantoate--beta-alanine ligase [Pseudobacteriovorax antillogorgiicola]TCS49484.1 pantothenate synthetase [Pseudobacteriovorax antillogorgiicola]SMF46075.1 pantothenate synthetase [Pseudobacteriovorax antillogorgiicola]
MSIRSFIDPVELRQEIANLKKAGGKIGFVPTMGALHQGHLSLLQQAKSECDYVVASIFVNPKQFGPNEDFSSYPRMIKEDLEKLEEQNVDAVFLPNARDMYPEGFQTYVDNEEMSQVLCGANRPGHFRGVLTVVIKLLNLVNPDLAIFGKKDYQQLKVIQAMARDLHLPMSIVGGEIVREPDGLAMSSRNLRLSAEERQQAPRLYQALEGVRESFNTGNREPKSLLRSFQKQMEGTGFRLQYAEIRDQEHLVEFTAEIDKPAVLAVAAFLGSVRLIDNIELGI